MLHIKYNNVISKTLLIEILFIFWYFKLSSCLVSLYLCMVTIFVIYFVGENYFSLGVGIDKDHNREMIETSTDFKLYDFIISIFSSHGSSFYYYNLNLIKFHIKV